jgi:hypothetical protein
MSEVLPSLPPPTRSPSPCLVAQMFWTRGNKLQRRAQAEREDYSSCVACPDRWAGNTFLGKGQRECASFDF